MKKMVLILVALILAVAMLGCNAQTQEPITDTELQTTEPTQKAKPDDTDKEGEQKLIGVLFRTLAEEKWTKERDMMLALAQERGCEVVFQSANDDVATQLNQCENLLAQGCKVLIILPVDDGASESIITMAHAENVPVISYDQIILNADLDYNVTFDSTEVGRKMATYAVEKAPAGKYVLLCGGPASNNATLIKNGWHEILDPFVQSGDIEIVYEQFCDNWSAEIAMQYAEDALTANNDDVAAILCANDNMANGAIQALASRDLAGKVVVTGQDADLQGCQNIAQGYQSLTVYKPSSELSAASMEAAFAILEGKEVATNSVMNNGFKDVPSIFLESIVVDKGNIDDTIIADGYQSAEDVYASAG